MKSPNSMFKKMISQLEDIENLSIVEYEMNIHEQQKFSKFWRENNIIAPENVDTEIELLFDELQPKKEKRISLFKLAASDEVKAFRALEKFEKKANSKQLSWAKYALTESKMKLEASFSDKKTIYLSTGLGGKGRNLRYFCIFPTVWDKEYTDFQHQIVKKELTFSFSKNEMVLEEITLEKNFISIVCLIPLELDMQKIFDELVIECNNYGDFMDESYILSNVRRYSTEEVKAFLFDEDKFFGLNPEMDKLTPIHTNEKHQFDDKFTQEILNEFEIGKGEDALEVDFSKIENIDEFSDFYENEFNDNLLNLDDDFDEDLDDDFNNDSSDDDDDDY